MRIYPDYKGKKNEKQAVENNIDDIYVPWRSNMGFHKDLKLILIR